MDKENLYQKLKKLSKNLSDDCFEEALINMSKDEKIISPDSIRAQTPDWQEGYRQGVIQTRRRKEISEEIEGAVDCGCPYQQEWHNRGKCCITDSENIIDDAGVYFEFGYGSKRDLQRFDFPLMEDDVAEKILQFIQMLMVEGRTIDEFKTDFLDKLRDEKK